MSVLTFPAVHSDIYWQNWPAQYVGKQRLESYVTALASPLDLLDSTLEAMATQRGINTSYGAQLDGVGVIVGQPRYVSGAFVLPFFGYEHQTATTGYGQARYRRMGESTEDVSNTIGDPEFRTIIRWKVVANSSAGTIPDIINALRVIFPNAVRIKVSEPSPRLVNVVVQLRTTANPLFANNLESFIPKMAGVRVNAFIERV